MGVDVRRLVAGLRQDRGKVSAYERAAKGGMERRCSRCGDKVAWGRGSEQRGGAG